MNITFYIALCLVLLANYASANVEADPPADRLGIGIVVPIERHRVAIIDHGFDLEHTNLRASFLTRLYAPESNRNSLDMRIKTMSPTESPFMQLQSGTEVASIIAAQDGLGLYPKTKLIPIDYSGNLVLALRKALEAYKRMPFIAINFSQNMSYSNTNPNQGYVDPMSGEAKYLFKTLLNHGVIFFISAGPGTNREYAQDAFRQDILDLANTYPDQIVIASNAHCESNGCEIDPKMNRAGKAYQHYLAVDARRIKVATPGDAYGEVSGTTAAAPLLLGSFLNLEDLIWTTLGQNLSGKQIVELMKSTAIHKDQNGLPLSPGTFGRGVFNYTAAYNHIIDLGRNGAHSTNNSALQKDSEK